MFWRWLLSLSCAGLTYALPSSVGEQSHLGLQPQHGVLRRYAFPKSQGLSIEDVLHITETSGGQVWQVGPSHVDVYFQPGNQQLDLPFPHAGTIPLKQLKDLQSFGVGGNLSSLANSTYHAVYHPLYEIEGFVQEMARTYPDIVQLTNIGRSAEGREMIAMQISKPEDELNRAGNSARKAGFVITGAQHSREWIATSTALYLAHALVADATEHFALSSWLDYFDFYIIAVPNPDGYAYTWDHDRHWYKNRQIVGPAEKCVGIDMNRNWGFKWKSKSRLPSLASDIQDNNERVSNQGADADPCSSWYPGHRPFEAPEVNNIANFITTLPALKAYVDLRSYGQMLSTPYSYSCKKVPKDAEDQLEAALGAANAIKQVHGTPFSTGSLCSQLYKASGNVVDYMYAKAGIKYAYSVHLRDTGTYGFSLPAEWIRPVGEETANMIRFLAGFVSGRNKKV